MNRAIFFPSATQSLLLRRGDVASWEHRLIMRTAAAPEAVPEAKKEKAGEEKEKVKEGENAEKKVEKEASKTKEEVKKVVPEVEPKEQTGLPNGDDEPSFVDSLERPSAPNWNALKKTAILGGVVAAPMAVIPAVAGYVVGKKAWSAMAKVPPFSWVDRGVRSGVSAVKSGLGAAGETIAYPFRETYKQAKNAVHIASGLGKWVFKKTLLEPYREITDKLKGPDAELSEGEEKGLHPLTVGYVILKWPFATAKNLVLKYAHQIITHPGRTLIGTAVSIPILYAIAQNPMGLIGAGKDLFGIIMSILRGIATKLGPAAAVP